jgi:hypothetical protein
VNFDLVLRDLAVPGGVMPTAMTQASTQLSEDIILWGSDGSGAGIDPGLPLVEIASRVQDWAVEELSSRALPTNWPPCPLHPTTHPLTAASIGARAVWQCPATAAEIAVIGSLPIPG